MALSIVPASKRLVSVAGIPVVATPAFLAISIVITAITFNSLAPDRGGRGLLLWYAGAAVIALGVLGSWLAHELGHAVAASRIQRRLHAIEPPLFGGLSDTAFPPAAPGDDARVAGGGPAVTFVLAGLTGAAAGLAGQASFDTVAVGFGYIAIANLLLLGISLAPGYPFDGGRMLRSFVWYLSGDLLIGTRVAAFYGQIIIYIGFLLSVVLLAVGEPWSVWGTWTLLLLWSANRVTHDSVQRTAWSEASKRITIDDIALGTSRRVSSCATIDEAIDDVLQAVHQGPTLVVEEGTIVGVFSLARVRRVPRALWPERRVGDVALALEGLPRIPGDSTLADLFTIFESTGVEIVLIGDEVVRGALDRHIAESRLRERMSAERRLRRSD